MSLFSLHVLCVMRFLAVVHIAVHSTTTVTIAFQLFLSHSAVLCLSPIRPVKPPTPSLAASRLNVRAMRLRSPSSSFYVLTFLSLPSPPL